MMCVCVCVCVCVAEERGLGVSFELPVKHFKSHKEKNR